MTYHKEEGKSGLFYEFYKPNPIIIQIEVTTTTTTTHQITHEVGYPHSVLVTEH